MHPPTHAELIDAIWTLAAKPGETGYGDFRPREICWSIYFGSREGMAGVIITVKGNPPKAWLVVQTNEGRADTIWATRIIHPRVYSCHALAPGNEARAFQTISAATQAWQASGELRGVMAAER